MSLRFSARAADDLRAAIREAEGVEVFAIGDIEHGEVRAVTVTCRGREDRVNALLDRPRTGQVVIHNHPSGDLRPSDADMRLAGRYGDDGIGVVIVDSDVTRSNWVVEPHGKRRAPVDRERLERFFLERLPAVLPDAEIRDEQLAMARDVARCLDEAEPVVVEAGTGTGKSLAYLVPAALWAMANDAKVVVSTYTRALQSQLFTKDLPLMARAGIEATTAVLQGRNNYLCKRRLRLVDDEEADAADRSELDMLLDWDRTTGVGARSDLPESIDPALWERVESDTDLTLRVRCPHYAACHYYEARRRAAGAHVVVVNHALLLADRSLRDLGAPGVIPKYERLVLDEAHHLEDAATGAIARRSSLRGIQRSSAPLLSRRKKRGALARLIKSHGVTGSALPPEQWGELEQRTAVAAEEVQRLRKEAKALLEALAHRVIDPDGDPRRIRKQDEDTPLWTDLLRPTVEDLASLVERSTGALDRVLTLFDDVTLPRGRAQPVFDVRRGRRRLANHAATLRAFLEHREDTCRWIERSRGRGPVYASVALAPIEVDQVLKRLLWDPLPGTTSTSATLTVAKQFDHWMRRSGLEGAHTALYPSPFDHFSQALLGLPRDLPVPDHPDYLSATARCMVEAIDRSGGGAFVLCTSYRAVRYYAGVLEQVLGPDRPLLVQTRQRRGALLDRFLEHRDSVLVGTDSFWEGVSVKGPGLRLVIIPRLPFRVPTDPLEKARHEQIEKRGGNAFRAYTLPNAVIKLRQGYGRLIRHKGDRGAVLILDRRLHARSYGRIILHSLPKARRISAPWRRVREGLERFFAAP